jgi:tRNA(adenine34) deaminase
MRLALKLAEHALDIGEVPVGAVLIKDDEIIATGCNHSVHLHDPTAHAEVLALREAGATLKDYRFTNTTLYVTLEPCPMCMSALIHARVARVVFGAFDPRQGAGGSAIEPSVINPLKHTIDVFGGVLSEECGAILRGFFEQKR